MQSENGHVNHGQLNGDSGSAGSGGGGSNSGKGGGGGGSGGSGGSGSNNTLPLAQRSRTACMNCRTTKQKCDGPTRIPCRRCELYNLECTYSEAVGRGSKRKATDEATNVEAVIPKPATVTSEIAQTILERLEELASRTRTIEDVLRITTQSGRSGGNGGSISGAGGGEPFNLPDTVATASNMRVGNPVSAIAESFQSMDDPYSAMSDATGDFPGYLGSPLSPDAVSRGLITIEQAQRYFTFFVDRCRYWVHGFVPQQFSDAMRVRTSCPLLFGAVCCVSSFFLDAPNGEAGLQLYLSLVSLVNETLAPIIMSPRSTELDDDFILGIALCIIWKSPRIERTNMNVAHFQRMQTLSKLNNSTTYFLAGIATRAARVNKLNITPSAFITGDSTPRTLARCRLWLWMCFVDAHGCMQNGRAPSIDITDSLKCTRSFAALNDHPTDVELCALLETASVYRSFHGQSEDDKTNLQALARANQDLDTISNYWYTKYPRLNYEGAFVTQFIAPFNRLVINADVYRSWSARNKAANDSNEQQNPPVLGVEEGKYLTKAIDAAQTILLNLSLAARGENGRRVGTFEEPQYWKNGYPCYKPMEPDADHARHIRTAVDTVICVIIVFSAMFLAKLRAASLIRCSLEVVTPSNPIQSWDPDANGRVALYSKFFRILELASDFLEMVAPNPGHPAVQQSRVLRSLLATATNRLLKVENGSNGAPIHQLAPQQMQAQHMQPHQQQQSQMLTQRQQQQQQMQQHTQQQSQSQQQPMLQHHTSLPKYSHTLIGQQTVDHSPNSPVATAPPEYMTNSMGNPMDTTFNDMLGGIGQPGNPLVPSFLGGDEWSMLMSSLGLKPS